jgi:hypothetical protein
MDRAIRSVGIRFLEVFSVDIIATLRTAARVIAQNLDDVVALVTKFVGGMVYGIALLLQGLFAVLDVVQHIARFFGADFGIGLTAAAQRANDLAAELQGARGELEKLQSAAGTGQDVGGQIATVERTISDLQSQLALQEMIANAMAWGSGQAAGFTDVVAKLTEQFRELYGVAREQASAELGEGGLLPDSQEVQKTTSDLETYFETVANGLTAWGDRLRDVKSQALDMVQTIGRSIEDNLVDSMWDALTGVMSWRDALRNALREILGDLGKMFLRQAVRGVLSMLIPGSGGGGGGGGIFSAGGGGGGAVLGGNGGKNFGGGGWLEGMSRGSGNGAMQAVGAGETHVHFTVHAIDAQSFRKALSEQRKDIIGMVTEAVRREPATRRLITGR